MLRERWRPDVPPPITCPDPEDDDCVLVLGTLLAMDETLIDDDEATAAAALLEWTPVLDDRKKEPC